MTPSTHRSRFLRFVTAVLTVLAINGALASPLTATVADAAEPPGVPGMCTGRSDANLVINAQTQAGTKFVLNVATDSSGHPTGVLILDRGPTRLYVDQFCRAWQHLAGQPPGACGDAIASTTAHAVGITQLEGMQLLVRTDVRQTDEGAFYRLRYRALNGHEAAISATEGEDCADDAGWTRVPTEGWAPLHHLGVRTI